jgi:hypothetical protein
MLMISRNVYAIQPYQVGTKDRKSLAIIIPAEITREYNIDSSTVLVLRVNQKTRRITLQTINAVEKDEENNMMIPTGEFPTFHPAGITQAAVQ